MPRLKHVPSFDGAFTHAGETWDMSDGIFEVDDSEIAAEMVESYTKISYAESDVDETPTPDADTSEDSEDICGTEMTDGSICQRPADSCPYHS